MTTELAQSVPANLTSELQGAKAVECRAADQTTNCRYAHIR
jgi:hypothetical protein